MISRGIVEKKPRTLTSCYCKTFLKCTPQRINGRNLRIHPWKFGKSSSKPIIFSFYVNLWGGVAEPKKNKLAGDVNMTQLAEKEEPRNPFQPTKSSTSTQSQHRWFEGITFPTKLSICTGVIIYDTNPKQYTIIREISP